MSCGRPHATPCTYVHEHLDILLDREASADVEHVLEEHLDECPPCLGQYVLQAMITALVAGSSGCAPAPEHLRVRVVQRITEVRIESHYWTE